VVKLTNLIEPEQRHSSAGVTFLEHDHLVTGGDTTNKLINVFNQDHNKHSSFQYRDYTSDTKIRQQLSYTDLE